MDYKEFRKTYHLTQEKFAAEIGVSRWAYRDWEKGKKKPSRENQAKLEAAMLRIVNFHNYIKQYQDNQSIINGYRHEIEPYIDDFCYPKFFKILLIGFIAFVLAMVM